MWRQVERGVDKNHESTGLIGPNLNFTPPRWLSRDAGVSLPPFSLFSILEALFFSFRPAHH